MNSILRELNQVVVYFRFNVSSLNIILPPQPRGRFANIADSFIIILNFFSALFTLAPTYAVFKQGLNFVDGYQLLWPGYSYSLSTVYFLWWLFGWGKGWGVERTTHRSLLCHPLYKPR